MKTVVQILRAPAGGIRKHVVDILENIDRTKFTSLFISNFTESDIDINYLQQAYNVEFINLPIQEKPSMKDLTIMFQIFLYLRKRKIDVLHGHGAKGGLYARLLKIPLRAKSVYTPHGGSLHRVHGKLKNTLYDFIEKILSPLTNHFVFESEYSKAMFAQNVHNPKSKAIVNLNGVALKEFSPKEAYTPGAKLKLASFGLYRHLKGHDIIISACRILKDKKIPFQYDIYGEGEFYQELKNLIAKLDLEQEITLYNYSGDVENSMMKYDFVVHPSRFESFGYVPVEAMAIGIPVICSQVGGLKEVVTHDTGLINTDNSVDQYVVIFENAFLGQYNLVSMINKARTRVSEKFSLRSMIDGLEKIYSQL